MEKEKTEQLDKILGREVYNESQKAHRDKRSTRTAFTHHFSTRFFFTLLQDFRQFYIQYFYGLIKKFSDSSASGHI